MGYPLRSNIFRPGSSEQNYFARFPIQVAVLFSPSDKEFYEAFRELFLHLDKLTGERIVFFAVMDPPREWLVEAERRSWWQEYQHRVGITGYTLQEDRALAAELTRMFNVAWNELPVLVVSTNLWNAEFAIVPTSQWYLEKQLDVLTNLVKEWGAPNLDQIVQVLEDELGDQYRYYPANQQKRYRFSRVYDVLDSYNPYLGDRYALKPRYWGLARGEVNASMSILHTISNDSLDQGLQGTDTGTDLDYAYEEAMGYLVAPATVAYKARIYYFEKPGDQITRQLEEEAQIEIDSAILTAEFLEDIASKKLRDIENIDFAGGASGLWRALELEINYSIIQAARKSRSLRMPEDFIRYVDSFPKAKSSVQTGTNKRGNPINKDINAEDKAHNTIQHKFLPLGDAWYVAHALSGNPTEGFDRVLSDLGVSISTDYMQKWNDIYNIRNPASHTRKLTYADYQKVLQTVLPDMFEPLITIKEALRPK